MKDYGKIDRKLMDHICLIARLDLSDAEKDRYAKELSAVLDAFRVIEKVDTNEEPSFHPIPITDRVRDDSVKPTDWNPLGNAKAKENGYFKGPKIM